NGQVTLYVATHVCRTDFDETDGLAADAQVRTARRSRQIEKVQRVVLRSPRCAGRMHRFTSGILDADDVCPVGLLRAGRLAVVAEGAVPRGDCTRHALALGHLDEAVS